MPRRRLSGLDLDESHEDPLAFGVATMLELSISKRISRAASAAIECALFDRGRKGFGYPGVGAAQGAKRRAGGRNATLTSGPPEDVAAQAADWAGEGYGTVKLKLGAGHDDVATVEAVREAIGPDVRIRVDANEAWDAKLATDLLNLIEPFGIELAEQPVSGLRAMARVAGDVGIPLAADEAISIRGRGASRGSARLLRVRDGQAFEGRRVRPGAADRANPPYLPLERAGRSRGIAAAAHGAQVLRADGTDPGVAHGLATQRLFAETIATRECELRDGQLHLPEGPGLGVELDEAVLERRALKG